MSCLSLTPSVENFRTFYDPLVRTNILSTDFLSSDYLSDHHLPSRKSVKDGKMIFMTTGTRVKMHRKKSLLKHHLCKCTVKLVYDGKPTLWPLLTGGRYSECTSMPLTRNIGPKNHARYSEEVVISGLTVYNIGF